MRAALKPVVQPSARRDAISQAARFARDVDPLGAHDLADPLGDDALATRGVRAPTQRVAAPRADPPAHTGAAAAHAEVPVLTDAETPEPVPAENVPPGGAIVQRRVGFEFQTPVKLRDAKDKSAPLKKPLLMRPNWHIECDSGDMEFVTEPLNTFGEVSETVGDIVAWGGALQEMEPTIGEDARVRSEQMRSLAEGFRKDEDVESAKEYDQFALEALQDGEARPLEKLPGLFLGKVPLFAVGSVNPLTAAPQSTIGIPLDKLISSLHLLTYEQLTLGSGKSQQQVKLVEGDSAVTMVDAHDTTVRLVNSLREKRQDVAEKSWRELESLLGLTASYIRTAQPVGRSAFAYAKMLAPLMSRVNFGALFLALPEDVRPYFTPETLAIAAGVSPEDRVFGRKGVSSKREPGPTVAEWAYSIRGNKDVLSHLGEHEDTEAIQSGSESMGEMDELDSEDPVHQQPLVPVELRRISKSVKIENWQALAEEIFIFAEALLAAKFY